MTITKRRLADPETPPAADDALANLALCTALSMEAYALADIGQSPLPRSEWPGRVFRRPSK